MTGILPARREVEAIYLCSTGGWEHMAA